MNNLPIKVAFLDRDGVINKEVNYLHDIEKFEYTDDCKQGLLTLTQLGFHIIVITNQAGIARGYYDEAQYFELTNWYLNDLKNSGINILDVYHCPHYSKGVVAEFSVECDCRKPKPGMINSAIQQHHIDINASILIGDKTSDIEAGIAAGIPRNYLVRSGHDLPTELSPELKPAPLIFDNLYQISRALVTL